MDKIIFHIDVNSAYLSWTSITRIQQGDTVDLRTIPAIIGGDVSKRRGVVLAKSLPAKKYGVRTGEPVTDALKKCPSLVSVSPDHDLYARYSNSMIQLLKTFSPSVAKYSIDECFMEYSPVDGDGGNPVKAAHMIKDKIRDTLGFTVNIGVSTNRLLAKMASDFKKPDLVHTLFPDEIQTKMWPLPIEELFMVGQASAKRLRLLGVKTIGDLAKMDPEIILSHLKSHGRTVWEYANGLEISQLDTRYRESKGIGNSTTISYDVTDGQEAKKILLDLAESVSKRLRDAAYFAGMVSVEIKYHTFESFSHQMQLPAPTNATHDIHAAACILFDELWNGDGIRLLGIRTSKLTTSEIRQLTLFDQPKDDKYKKLDQALDDIRKKYGDDAIVRGSKL